MATPTRPELGRLPVAHNRNVSRVGTSVASVTSEFKLMQARTGADVWKTCSHYRQFTRDRTRYRSEVSGSWLNNRRGDDTICQRLIDSGSIANETNSCPFLHRRRLRGLWTLWTTRAGATGTGRTTYRVPVDNSLEGPDIRPVQEKVPGESR
jgi:hypothetical protein